MIGLASAGSGAWATSAQSTETCNLEPIAPVVYAVYGPPCTNVDVEANYVCGQIFIS